MGLDPCRKSDARSTLLERLLNDWPYRLTEKGKRNGNIAIITVKKILVIHTRHKGIGTDGKVGPGTQFRRQGH